MIFGRAARSRGSVSVPGARAVAMAVTLALAGACSLLRADGPPPELVIDAAYARVLSGSTLDDFDRLAGGRSTPLDPASARLVGPTFGVHLDATAVTTSVDDGLLFESLARHLHPDDVSARLRGTHRTSPGHELVLAHVPVGQHLPEPDLGYPSDGLFTGWQVMVDGRPLALTDNGDPPSLGTGSVLAVSVPVGSDPYLYATADGRTQMISMRTGRPPAA
ncbi:hypothetical protein [Pseudofrankia saprophytica]|uniref:hypothetical protein n=1 Tax=Pseudofrankia saprophytica TaxID=298655 RepID=UPI001E5B5A2F|nr:hypothetical protein [Pseudofrankia saprophytica]